MSKLDDKLKQWYYNRSGVMLSDEEVAEMRSVIAAFGEMMMKWCETPTEPESIDSRATSK